MTEGKIFFSGLVVGPWWVSKMAGLLPPLWNGVMNPPLIDCMHPNCRYPSRVKNCLIHLTLTHAFLLVVAGIPESGTAEWPDSPSIVRSTHIKQMIESMSPVSWHIDLGSAMDWSHW